MDPRVKAKLRFALTEGDETTSHGKITVQTPAYALRNLVWTVQVTLRKLWNLVWTVPSPLDTLQRVVWTVQTKQRSPQKAVWTVQWTQSRLLGDVWTHLGEEKDLTRLGFAFGCPLLKSGEGATVGRGRGSP